MVSLALASAQTQREQEILAYRTRGNWQVLRAALDMTGTELYVPCAFSSFPGRKCFLFVGSFPFLGGRSSLP